MIKSPRRAALWPFSALLLLAAAALACSVAFAAADPTAQYTNAITSLQATAGGTSIATIQPAAAVVVRASSGAFSQIELTGWSPQGGEKYLFKQIGIRIGLAVMTDDGVGQRLVIGSQDDAWGSTWENVRITGWIATQDLAADLDVVWSEAGQLYFSHCSRCHSLRRPEEFTANQWPSVLKIMTKRAGFTADEAALVTMLLQSHGKDQKVSDTFTQAEANVPVAAAPVAVPAIVGTPELSAQGMEVYDATGCNACHGDDTRTPAIPEYPRLGGQSPEYLYKQLLDFRAGARTNDAFSVMKEITAGMTNADATAVAYWLSLQ